MLRTLLLSLSLLLAAALLPNTRTDAAGAASSLEWSDCYEGFDCATLSVPLDHRNPDGDHVGIAVIRQPAKDPAQRIGVLIANPGGPWGSGVQFVRYLGPALDESLKDRFDIVSFDPRGVSGDTRINCVDAALGERLGAVDPSPRTPAEIAEIRALYAEMGRGCGETHGELLRYLDTQSVARDMEMLRGALGEATISYLGYSYGSLLGQRYAELFPNRLRAYILDGVIDPALSGSGFLLAQASGFELALNGFFDWCMANEDCDFRPREGDADLGATFDHLIARMEEAPLVAIGSGDPNPVTVNIAINVVFDAMYNFGIWPVLGTALSLADKGDGALLLILATPPPPDPELDEEPAGLLTAVLCLDQPYPRTEDELRSEAAELRRTAPRLGGWFSYWFGCTTWPVRTKVATGPVRATGAPTALVIGTTFDPATPYKNSVAVAAALDDAVLLTLEGYGHTGFNGSSVCIDTAVAAYLISLTLPAEGTVCQQDSLPDLPVEPPPPPAPTPQPEPTRPVGITAPDTGSGGATSGGTRPAGALAALALGAIALVLSGAAVRGGSRRP